VFEDDEKGIAKRDDVDLRQYYYFHDGAQTHLAV
jgi:hypothetical protein